jgi:hypothetical protein
VATEHDEHEHDEHDEHGEADQHDAEVGEPLAPLEPVDVDVVANARRRYGSAGAGLAAAMFGVDQALTGKQKPEFVQVQEASSEPLDVDNDGITVTIDEVMSVQAPALERRAPLGLNKKPRRR